jgi:hypothetical protein
LNTLGNPRGANDTYKSGSPYNGVSASTRSGAGGAKVKVYNAVPPAGKVAWVGRCAAKGVAAEAAAARTVNTL